MGGVALGPAEPLNSDQFAHFEQYTCQALRHLFTKIHIEYCPKNKKTHGDLDLLCGVDVDVEFHIGGRDQGRIDEVKEEGIDEAVLGSRPSQEDLRRLTLLCVRAVNGTRWLRTGSQICVAVPIYRVLDGITGNDNSQGKEKDTESFFQLDINLIPLASFDLAFLQMSYRSNLIILPRAVSTISMSLYLDTTGLYVRHAAYPGLQAIIVPLTHSAREVCDWLGLNWERFDSGAFVSEEELYLWFATVRPGGAIGVVWEKVSDGSIGDKWRRKHASRKTEGWDFMVEWMRTSGNCSYASVPVTARIGSTELGVTVGPLEAGKLPAKPAMTPPPPLDPESPVPLDNPTMGALRHWSKFQSYQEELAKGKKCAVELYNKQTRRKKADNEKIRDL